MKLVTYEVAGSSRTGVLVEQRVFDAEAVLHEWRRSTGASSDQPSAIGMRDLLDGGAALLSDLEAAIAQVADDPAAVSHQLGDVRLVRPIAGTKFIGVGLNYRDHALEQNAKIPANPILFAKFDTSLIGAEDAIRYPASTAQLDFEAELGVVIGRGGRDIPLEDALAHVGGYTIVNDVTARDLQLADRQWVRGKTLDAMTPVGPWIVTPDEVGDAGALRISLSVNGQVMQDSSTSELIFGIAELVSFISQDFTLEPGDLIATGTPAGVGFARDPAVFLQRGDVVEVEIERLGRQRNEVV